MAAAFRNRATVKTIPSLHAMGLLVKTSPAVLPTSVVGQETITPVSAVLAVVEPALARRPGISGPASRMKAGGVGRAEMRMIRRKKRKRVRARPERRRGTAKIRMTIHRPVTTAHRGVMKIVAAASLHPSVLFPEKLSAVSVPAHVRGEGNANRIGEELQRIHAK
jgi:hypothetical protein